VLPDSAAHHGQLKAEEPGFREGMMEEGAHPMDSTKLEIQTKVKQDTTSADSLLHKEGNAVNNNPQPRGTVQPDSSAHHGQLKAEEPGFREGMMEEGARPMDSTKLEIQTKVKQDTTSADSLLHKEGNALNNNPQPRGTVQPDSSAHPHILNREEPASDVHTLEQPAHRIDSTKVDSTKKKMLE
jgi:hypothetical protein